MTDRGANLQLLYTPGVQHTIRPTRKSSQQQPENQLPSPAHGIHLPTHGNGDTGGGGGCCAHRGVLMQYDTSRGRASEALHDTHRALLERESEGSTKYCCQQAGKSHHYSTDSPSRESTDRPGHQQELPRPAAPDTIPRPPYTNTSTVNPAAAAAIVGFSLQHTRQPACSH